MGKKRNDMITIPVVQQIPLEEAERLMRNIFASLSYHKQGMLLSELDVLHRASIDDAKDELHDYGMNEHRSLRLEQESI